MLWRSKLQTKIVLSAYEAKYIALSTTMREVILLMQLLEDIKVAYNIVTMLLEVSYKAFEDNQSYIAVTDLRNLFPMQNILQLNIITSAALLIRVLLK